VYAKDYWMSSKIDSAHQNPQKEPILHYPLSIENNHISPMGHGGGRADARHRGGRHFGFI
jgi:hypothetical protein